MQKIECVRCGKWKAVDEFYRYRNPKKQSRVCKECQRRRQRERYATDPEYRSQIAARDRARRLGLEVPSFRKPRNPKRFAKDFPPRSAPDEQWRCVRCGEMKSAAAFYLHRDPRKQAYICRDCHNRSASDRYRTDSEYRERVKARARAAQHADAANQRRKKRDYYAANKGRFADYAKDNRARIRGNTLSRRYGLTLDGYNEMLIAQEKKCAICQHPHAEGQPLHVDYDHSTGRIRALLCRRCNTGLAHFSDKLELLAAAANYLRRFA